MKWLTVLVIAFAIVASVVAALLYAAGGSAAQSASDLKIPTGYRSWFHVNTLVIDKASPLFEALGGMHNIYINSTGQEALKKGGPYPDGSIFLDDLHEVTASDGSYAEGARKAITIMIKDNKQTSTGVSRSDAKSSGVRASIEVTVQGRVASALTRIAPLYVTSFTRNSPGL